MTSPGERASYTIARIPDCADLTCDSTAQPWVGLDAVQINRFPWCVEGAKQQTTVRAGYGGDCIYVHFGCEDSHISASRTELNGDVCRDSCVEFFATVAEAPNSYFNLEINCCGVIHLGYGSGRADRTHVRAETASGIRVAGSVPGLRKAESRDDDGWSLACALPLGVLSDLAGTRVSVGPGTQWRGNFYRCGGVSDAQYACWSSIRTPRADFHRPGFFGVLAFA